jgi:TolA-binding protein
MLLCISTLQIVAQQSDFYTVTDRIYDQAVELFEKEKYSAAQEQFKIYIDAIDQKQDEIRINAEYYYARFISFTKMLNTS